MSNAVFLLCSLMPAQSVPVTIVNDTSTILGDVVGRVTATREPVSDQYSINGSHATSLILNAKPSDPPNAPYGPVTVTSTLGGATATAFCVSQGEVEGSSPRVYSYTSSEGTATVTLPPGGMSIANAGIWEPNPFTKSTGTFRAQIGTPGETATVWVFSDVYAETNCGAGRADYWARGEVSVNGPGSAAEMEDPGRLVYIDSSLSRTLDGQIISETYWAVTYYDEDGDPVVEDATEPDPSYQTGFRARTPFKVFQGMILDDGNVDFWLRQPKTFAKSQGYSRGYVDPSETPKNSNASGSANGDISLSASQ